MRVLAVLAVLAMAAVGLSVGPQAEGQMEPATFDGDPSTTGRINTANPTQAAIDISQIRFTDGEADHGVLSRDDEFADSLAGSALTGAGPLLFTDTATLTPDTRQELDRALSAGQTVYLLGGEQAISAAVADELAAAGYQVERLAGPTRVETSVAVADTLHAQGLLAERALLARADAPPDRPTAAWADSVTGGGYAAQQGAAVLLTQSAALHGRVADALDRYQPTETVLLGGTAALSADVEQQTSNSRRVAGAERTETAAQIAERLWTGDEQQFTAINTFDERGWAFGLAAAGLAADHDAPLLAVAADHIPGPTSQLIADRGGGQAVEFALIGDAELISEQVRSDLGTSEQPPDEEPPEEPSQPEAVQLSGEGDTLTDPFTLTEGLFVAEMEHTGESNFAPWLLDDQGEKESLLANTTGNYQGEYIDNIDTAGEFSVDVSADGPWSITISQPEFASGRALPTTYQGSGDTVPEAFETDGGLVRFDYEHTGDGNFAVWLWKADGTREALIANEIGDTQGSTGEGLDAGVYILGISADGGDWTIDVTP